MERGRATSDGVWRAELPEDFGGRAIIAVAVHDGHGVREEVARLLALDDAGRLREEDPFTGEWTAAAPSRLVGLRSRFEVDLNRPRASAVYRVPADAWGLQVWHGELPEDVVARSLAQYDAFYSAVAETLGALEKRFGRFVVYDLHSYNHRRVGPDAQPADERDNPQVNIGTGTMDRTRWEPVVDRFMADLARFDFPGGRLDVRENVRFRGGQVPRWVHQTFPETGCCIAIEFKKFFMDEWSGAPDRPKIDAIGRAVASTVPGVLEALERL